MSDHTKSKARKHKVLEHSYNGKSHFWAIKSVSGETYLVSLDLHCSCKFSSVQGAFNGKICSHILTVLDKIVEGGQINEIKNNN